MAVPHKPNRMRRFKAPPVKATGFTALQWFSLGKAVGELHNCIRALELVIDNKHIEKRIRDLANFMYMMARK